MEQFQGNLGFTHLRPDDIIMMIQFDPVRNAHQRISPLLHQAQKFMADFFAYPTEGRNLQLPMYCNSFWPILPPGK